MFLVDTNVVSELIRPRPNLPLVRRLLSTDPAALFASEITRYELRFGTDSWSALQAVLNLTSSVPKSLRY
jgi:predicted nucleic acid-binding protein